MKETHRIGCRSYPCAAGNPHDDTNGFCQQAGRALTQMISWTMALVWGLALFGNALPAHAHGDSMGTATSIGVGSSESGAIDWEGDEDWFAVDLSSSGTLTAYTTGNTDTYGYLVDSSGSTLTYNDDDPYPNFRVSASVGPGTYYIRIRHYSSTGTGDYTFETSFSSGSTSGSTSTTASNSTSSSGDAGNSISSALAISIGSGYSDWINYSGDEDFFRVQLGSSGTLTAYSTGSTDTYGYILDSNGSMIEFNDDNPYPNFNVSASVGAGTYYIRVRHYSSTGTGAYTLYTEFSGSVSTSSSGGSVTLGEALDNTGLAWSTFGDASWHGQTGAYYTGGDAAVSGSISHNQICYLETTVSGPATLSYHWSVSSESGYDFLRFWIDGVQQAAISGEVGWISRSFNLASGSHTLRWTYSTDGSVLNGSNCGWVDGVQVTSSVSTLSTPTTTPDLLLRHPTYGLNGIWFMNNAQLQQSGYILPDLVPDLNWRIAGAGDFNRDGKNDIVWQHETAGLIGVWFMDGRAMVSPGFTNPDRVSDIGWRIVAVADFNLDNNPDLLWQHDSTTQIGIWYMNGLNLTSAVLTSPSAPSDYGWTISGVGDFNRDGRPDLLWRHSFWDQIGVWYMNGATYTGSNSTSPYSAYDIAWHIVDTGDFNRDGYPDLLWQHQAYGTIAIWHMNNVTRIGSTLTAPSTPDPWTWQVQAVADFDFLASQSTDIDNDLMPDGWEQSHFGLLSRTGTGDYDGDGTIDLHEYRNGTNPTIESGLKVFTPLE